MATSVQPADFLTRLGCRKPVIAMIHVRPLPGTPLHRRGSFPEILDRAAAEARLYEECGVDALAIENMHDIPYVKGHAGPEIVASMTSVAKAVTDSSGLPCGIQILAGANREAMAVAAAAGLCFIRAEGFVFAHVADEGIIESSAGELLRYRKAIGAEGVMVLADIKKKHSSHAMTSDVGIAETARAAEFFLADGLIVTGTSTGCAADLGEVAEVKRAVGLPVLIGSGVTIDNLSDCLSRADGLIVGSYFKEGGKWTERVDPSRVRKFMDLARVTRGF